MADSIKIAGVDVPTWAILIGGGGVVGVLLYLATRGGGAPSTNNDAGDTSALEAAALDQRFSELRDNLYTYVQHQQEQSDGNLAAPGPVSVVPWDGNIPDPDFPVLPAATPTFSPVTVVRLTGGYVRSIPRFVSPPLIEMGDNDSLRGDSELSRPAVVINTVSYPGR